MNKHTKKPWELPHLVKEDTTCNCGHVFAGYVTVCTVHDHTHDSGSGEFLTQEEAEANARLIPSAPDMYQAIRDLFDPDTPDDDAKANMLAIIKKVDGPQ